ncbi:hypothetical protein HPP92_019557 [Vanilla planifolia]|uniref:Uncharacterized protein n=1 Tax=Vanilla planifolia TaxID=51239 RepID=A0A835QAI6_VANPL|nr:hypothetical protein HPP92_019557 [Vanilla planifolia]
MAGGSLQTVYCPPSTAIPINFIVETSLPPVALSLTRSKAFRRHSFGSLRQKLRVLQISSSLPKTKVQGKSSVTIDEDDRVPDQFLESNSISDFLRFKKRDTGIAERGGTGELQTAVVSYRKTFPWSLLNPFLEVDLFSTIHIADKEYFDTLQKRLDSYDCVLYEMLTTQDNLENKRNCVSARRIKASHSRSFSIVGFIQRKMAQILALDFQLDCLNYLADNWLHADLDFETFKMLQLEKGENLFTFARDMTLRSTEAFVQSASIPEDLDPWRTILLRASRVLPMPLVGFLIIGIACSPLENQVTEFSELEALFRFDIGTALKIFLAKRLTSEFTQSTAAVEENSVIIGERNRVATLALRTAIDCGHRRIALLYGAWSITKKEPNIQSLPFLRTLAEISGWPLNRTSSWLFRPVEQVSMDNHPWTLAQRTVRSRLGCFAAHRVERAEEELCVKREERSPTAFGSWILKWNADAEMEFWPEFLASSWGKEFVAGGLGGMAGVVAGHPFDTLRIHLQQPSSPSSPGSGRPSATALFRSILRTEGPAALYRGMAAPFASVAFQNAMAFQVYALLSRACDPGKNDEPPPTKALPWLVELIKIRLQLQTTNHHHRRTNPKGPLTIAKSILHTEGIRGIYRGFLITILRDAPAHGVYFWTYEYAREHIHPGCRTTGDESLATMLFAGGLAGVASWVCCYPLDVVKSRLQAESRPLGSQPPPRYNGIMDCFRKSVREEGFSVLWRGLGAAVTRAFVVNGAIFSAYELALRLLVNGSHRIRLEES